MVRERWNSPTAVKIALARAMGAVYDAPKDTELMEARNTSWHFCASGEMYVSAMPTQWAPRSRACCTPSIVDSQTTAKTDGNHQVLFCQQANCMGDRHRVKKLRVSAGQQIKLIGEIISQNDCQITRKYDHSSRLMNPFGKLLVACRVK